MASIQSLCRLAQHFDPNLSTDDVEDLLDSHQTNGDDAADTDVLQHLSCVQYARQNLSVRTELRNLIAECHQLTTEDCPSSPSRQRSTTFGWADINRAGNINPDQLVAYFICLVHLGRQRPGDSVDRKLGLLAARAYVLLCTVPEAEVYGVFQPDVLRRIFGHFGLLAKLLRPDAAWRLRDHEQIDLLMDCVALQLELQRMLPMVSLADHLDVKKALVRTLNAIIVHYFELVHRSKYSLTLYDQCFGIFDALLHRRHGAIAETMRCLQSGTFRLHRFTGKVHGSNGTGGRRPKYDTIADWFLEQLSVHPQAAASVLSECVQAILSRPELSTAQTADANMNICARYESALWRNGHTAVLQYVLEVLAAQSEAGQRQQAVDFAARLLTSEVVVVVREAESSDSGASTTTSRRIHREEALLEMLLTKTMDVSNGVKMRAMAGILRLPHEGNARVKELLRVIFIQRTREATTPYHTESLEEYREKIHTYTRHNIKNPSALVRKAALQMLAFIGESTDSDLKAFLDSDEMRALLTDVSPLVRRQLVVAVDQLLQARPSCNHVIEAYVRITLDLATDDDTKVADTVAECFKRNFFANIETADRTKSERSRLPWKLFRAMLSGEDMPDVRTCIAGWVHKKLLTPTILERIESHVHSRRASEAWMLLSMVASHIKSQQPVLVVTELTNTMHSQEPEAMNIAYSQLQVLASWLDHLPAGAQSEVQRLLDDLLGIGSIAPRMVWGAFDICSRIWLSRSAAHDDAGAAGAHDAWAETVLDRCLALVRHRMKALLIGHVYDMQLMSCMFAYAAAVTVLPDGRPDAELVAFLHRFLKHVATNRIKSRADSMLMVKVNNVQVLLTQLALFNYEVCFSTVPVFGTLLVAARQPKIIITSIGCLKDLYKKHTSLAETVLPLMLAKTRHDHGPVRRAALQNIAALVIDEFIKFRGSLLVYVLAALLDELPECAELAAELLYKHRAEKNPVILRSCMLECPFVLNGYMYMDNMDMFSRTESSLRSPILGAERQQDRQYVYQFLVDNVEVVYCYMYFENVRIIADKLKHQREQMLQPEGLAAIRDFMYVLTYICRAKDKCKQKVAEPTAETTGTTDDALPAADDVPNNAAAVTSSAAVVAAAGRGRGRNAGPTMEQAQQVIEKVLPQIADLADELCTIDETFIAPFHLLCTAICDHFVAHTQFAQPRDFWDRYRHKEPPLSYRVDQPRRPSSARAAATPKFKPIPLPIGIASSQSSLACLDDNNLSSDDDNSSDRNTVRRPAKRKPNATPMNRRLSTYSSDGGASSDDSSRNTTNNNGRRLAKMPTAADRRDCRATSVVQRDGDFLRPPDRSSRSRTPLIGGASRKPQRDGGAGSASESESDDERRTNRLARKRS